MGQLKDLVFDNTVLQALPVRSGLNQTTPVRGAIYVFVNPTPLRSPSLVAASDEALLLLGLDPSEADRPEFVEAVAGNKILPGSQPAAHCYCGYQFGYFAGQLGDGAAIYLGEVVGPTRRLELQLKGAGLTPFSRQADGRKVLRSSLREFLASEAMAGLGIPTTRAGSLVVSQKDTVIRDITYSGNPAAEACAVITRIAPTFIRFGSFEICKASDKDTGRAGPSAGLQGSLLPQLIGFTIRSYFRDIWDFYGGGDDISMKGMGEGQVLDIVEAWYTEVCRRTAHLVAGWQGVGFVHGVLNTDNMSILGLTIDYGPYGFMDRFDSNHVSNGSDDGARYTYAAQPGICRWNCERLADAIASATLPAGTEGGGNTAAAAACETLTMTEAAAIGGSSNSAGVSLLPPARAKRGLAVYDEELDRAYRAVMRRKLGLIGLAGAAATAATANGPYSNSSSNSAGTAAAHGSSSTVPGSTPQRPSWPISNSSSLAVAAAAAAAAAAATNPEQDKMDDLLIADLLQLMEDTGADFTGTFRRLAKVPMPRKSGGSSSTADEQEQGANGSEATVCVQTSDSKEAAAAVAAGADGNSADFGGFLPEQLAELASPAEMAAGSKPSMPLENVQMLMMLAGRDTALLHSLGVNPGMLQQQLAAHKAAAKWAATSTADKAAQDLAKWRAWLKRYQQRLQQEADADVSPELRIAVMNATNPRLVLRNWIAQHAITAAEQGNYNPTRHLLKLLRDPYNGHAHLEVTVTPGAAAAAVAASNSPAGVETAGKVGSGVDVMAQPPLETDVAAGAAVGVAAAATAAAAVGDVAGTSGVCPMVTLRYDGKPPAWAAKLCVTCSS